MAEIVRMPKMSDTMTEGVMAKWHKKVGDKVKSGDVLAEVETDKATMDLESYWDGTILYIGVEEGQAVPVDAVIAVIGKEGEDYKAALDAEDGAESAKNEKVETKTESPDKTKEDKQEEGKQEEAPKSTALSDSDMEKMGVTVVRMPLLSDTMTEGVIAEWHKKVGDKVKDDDILADVETDKATMEVMGYAEGTLLHIGVEKGQAAKVNGIIAIVGPEGTDISGFLNQGEAPAKPVAEKSADAPVAENGEGTKEEATLTTNTSGDRLKASPLAKRIAKDKGIDLNQVSGSADGGRITKKDIENFKPAEAALGLTSKEAAPAFLAEKHAAPLPVYVGEERFTEKPVTQMRKVIAKRLAESLFTAPHFYLTMSIDMDGAIAARTKMNEFASVKISFNDLVLKAVAIALKQHPNVNSSWLGDKIRYNEHVNIGVAVAVEDGLLVPVVRFADGKSLSRISAEVKDFAQRAKAKKLQPADWEGSTFTISNLGMFGIDEFTAIINPPDACILAIGGIAQVPVVKNGAIVPGNVMKVTLSCDHRVVDGATGSAFLQTLKALLEEPVRLLI
ncbi:MAG: 2-oxo acid dehydrogenase subunit E2 [Pedobacter sp.]|nr:2-oxo acid dehydrogenase subunit E2 [Pedobacter sp.]